MSLSAVVISRSAVSRTNARHALEIAGFAPVSAADDVDRAHDAALIVIALPEPARGAALRRLRQARWSASIPVLAIVEGSDVGARLDALGAGANDCVAEPYNPSFFGASALALATTGRTQRGRGGHGPARVLLIDDSATYAGALAEQLRRDGHDIIVATGAAEALDLLAIEAVDVIVLDVFMPGVGGVELCSRIRARPATADVPVLMLTGRKDTTLRDAGLAAGADDFVVKSGDFDAIREHVAELVSGAPGSSQRAHRRAHAHAHGSDPAPPSSVSPATHSDRAPAPPSSHAPDSGLPFLERVVAATGLSPLTGKSCVQRACARAGVSPQALSPANLDKVLPFLESTLRVFAAPGEVAARLAAIVALLRAPQKEHPR